MIRQPIVAMMGHVDHGKTLLLDTIRGTAIAAREAGGITQAIGASIIPLGTIKKVCGNLLESLKTTLTVPGLLFIDTPGHAAFVNLRKRGGNLADIAILVIDITEGVKPQTRESIEILKQYKTPFIIALNKVDLLQGWRQHAGSILQSVDKQRPETIKLFETKLYEIVGQVFESGLEADRYDRVSDYTKQIAMIPVSAKTGEGIPELLMMLTGLAQRYLEQKLHTNVAGQARGTILEVKEEKGLGAVLDVIIYDGSLHVGDEILIATLNEPIHTKIKALFEPAELAEMREKKSHFKPVKEVRAATGVRIVAPNIEHAVSGMPVVSVVDIEKDRASLKTEVHEVLTETDKDGIIIKADSLGSLEALMTLLKEKEIPIRKSSIGPISKKDLTDAEAIAQNDPLHGVILGFNLKKPDLPTTAHVICDAIIYKLIENYEEWRDAQKKKIEMGKLTGLVKPCKIEILQGYVFRRSGPAVVGVEVLAGTLTSNTPVMNKQGKSLTTIKGIQSEQKNVEQAEKGKQVSASLPNITIGRQVHEGDILYSAIPEEDFRQYKENKEHLTGEEKGLLKEIAEIMREQNPMWGI